MLEFKKQLQKWHDDDAYEKIITAIRNIPESERDFDLVKQLIRALNNNKCYDEALTVLNSVEEQGRNDSYWNFYMGWAFYHRSYIINGEIDQLTFETSLSYFSKAKQLGNIHADKFIDKCKIGLELLEKKSQENHTIRKVNSRQNKEKFSIAEWKNNLAESCADELEDLILDNVKAGFLSNEEIKEECESYIEENYPDDEGKITNDDLLAVITVYREKFQNSGTQENFLKLDLAFNNMKELGIITAHCADYTQSGGFDVCNEEATERDERGGKLIGCCFYTMQDLEHILHNESTSLYVSFGNYFEKPSAKEIGQLIIIELEKAGFSTEWDKSADTKIAITKLVWDKRYSAEA